jgi:hypothetical protein
MLLRYENYILPLTSIAVVAEAHKRQQTAQNGQHFAYIP